MRTKHLGSITALVILVICAVVAGWVFINRQFVIDQLTVWQYTPSTSVASIADRADLSDEGRFYFYASRPEVESTQKFNTECQRKEEHSAILGCYVGTRIFIYDVKNTQLDGIEEVTAAHEMLHAAWDRLSDTERAKLTPLLEAAYQRVADDELRERMDYYARAQPGERVNELHSIIGTEFANLGSELENHYKQYFSDRSKIVSFHNNYKAVFNTLEAQSTALLNEIKALEQTINTKVQAYTANKQAVEQENQDLQSAYSQLNRSSPSAVNAYNARVSAFNARVNELRAEYNTITSLTAQYNAKVVEYNQVVTSQQNLQKSLDSNLAPAPSV
jgi:DNA repair exonuclease SbcCD ATPase subunit